MKRRTFLKQSVGASLLLAGVPQLARRAEADEAKWRSFEVTTRVEVTDTVGATRAWVPVPLMVDTDYFRRQGPDTWKGNAATSKLYRDDKYDAGFVYAEWAAAEKAPAIEIVSRFSDPRSVRGHHQASGRRGQGRPAVLRKYLEPTKLIPTDGIVLDTSLDHRQGTDGRRRQGAGDLRVDRGQHVPRSQGARAAAWATSRRCWRRAISAASAPTSTRSSSVSLARPACRPATSTACACADSAEFKSLGKSGDISKAQHCRAEVFSAGYGWVPVDPADVRKVVLEEKAGGIALTDPQAQKARGKLFGAWEMNWLAYNYAHDVKLPNSTGKAVAFLMYPQAEVGDGRKDSLDPTNFRYTITSRELT